MKEGKVILGGYLKFKLNRLDVWGPSTRVDRFANLFNYHIEASSLINIDPIDMVPTWRNNVVGMKVFPKVLIGFLF